MIESVLDRNNVKYGIKLTIKTLISSALIALAVILPQLLHLSLGQAGGVKWLPMYLPVLIGGCILGVRWGLGVAILSPVVSFALTSMWGEAMPVAARLPFMIAELAVFAAVTGAFSKKIAQNLWMAFPAVILAQISGRIVFLALVAAFESISSLSASTVWLQIRTGLVGLYLQTVLVPFAVIALGMLLKRRRQ